MSAPENQVTMPPVIYAGIGRIGRDWSKVDEFGRIGRLGYTRNDLVNELKGYTRHSVGCSAYQADSDKPCDCGLTALLKRMEE